MPPRLSMRIRRRCSLTYCINPRKAEHKCAPSPAGVWCKEPYKPPSRRCEWASSRALSLVPRTRSSAMSADAPVYELHRDPSSSYDDEKHSHEEKQIGDGAIVDEKDVAVFDP